MSTIQADNAEILSSNLLLALLGGVLPFLAWAVAPFLSDPFTIVKWHIVHAVAVFCVLVLGAIQTKIYFPNLGWLGTSLLLGLSLALGFTYLVMKHLSADISLVDRASLVILTVAGFQVFHRNSKHVFTFSILCSVAAAGIVAIGFANILTNQFPILGAAATFGNVNMTSEFLGLTLPFQVYGLRRCSHKKTGLALEAVVAGTIVYLGLLLTRSVWLASLAAMLCLALLSALPSRTSLIRIAILVAGLSLTINRLQIHWNVDTEATPIFDSDTVARKMSSSAGRLKVWEGAIDAVIKNPLGIGPGNFEFGAVPYLTAVAGSPASEKVLFRSPHNEYLRFAVEDGISSLFFWLAFNFLIFWRVFKTHVEREEDRLVRACVLALGSFLAIEGFFQFPLENSFGFYMYSMTLGLAFAVGFKPIYQTTGLKTTLIAASIATFIAIFTGKAIVSNLYSGYMNNYSNLKLACRLDAGNWRACIRQARFEFAHLRNLERAKTTVESMLTRNKFNFLALKLRGDIYHREGQTRESCHVYWLYNAIFHDKSRLQSILPKICDADLLQDLAATETIETYRLSASFLEWNASTY